MIVRRICLLVTTAGLILMGSGCVDMSVHVRTNNDGSGQITVHGFAIRPQAGAKERRVPLLNELFVSMQKQVATQMGVDFDQVYDRDKFERLAKRFGPGVRLKSGQAVKRKDGSNGFVAIYTVADVNQVKIGPRIAQDFIGNDEMELLDWHYRLKYRNDAEQRRMTVIPPRAVDRNDVMSARESLGALVDLPGFLPFIESCLKPAKLKMFFSFESDVKKTNGSYRHATNPKAVVLADVQAALLVKEFGLPRLLEIKTPGDLVPIHQRKFKGILLEHPTKPLEIDLKR